MFERFSDRARRVVVLAQEEARMLNHNYIGTEHILLGLLHEGEGVAALTLQSLGISREEVGRQIEKMVGAGQTSPSGHIPFTPPAKRALELAHREALQLGHNYIGTEHLLLGLVREGEGVAARVLMNLGAGLDPLRSKIIELLTSGMGERPVIEFPEGTPVAFAISREEAMHSVRYDPAAGPLCSMCKRPLIDTAAFRILEVSNVADGVRRFLVLYCGACGDTIKVETLPEEG